MFLHIIVSHTYLKVFKGRLRGARGTSSPIPAVEQGGPIAPGSGGGGVALGGVGVGPPHTTIVVLL